MLKTVIVEDELSSQETLQNYLEAYCSGIEVVGLAANIEEGKKVIEATKPDLVFLDVEMPFGTGFDLLESLEEVTFQTVFVTAFSHYAIRAIQYSASNYILKPIDIDELVAAVDKVKKEDPHKIDATSILLQNIRSSQQQETKVVLPVIDGFEVIQAQEVIHCKSEDNFTLFTLENGQQLMICRTLKFYQEILEPLGFLRIHKSHLINLERVRKYIKGSGGFVVMSNGAELPVSPKQKSLLIERLAGNS